MRLVSIHGKKERRDEASASPSPRRPFPFARVTPEWLSTRSTIRAGQESGEATLAPADLLHAELIYLAQIRSPPTDFARSALLPVSSTMCAYGLRPRRAPPPIASPRIPIFFQALYTDDREPQRTITFCTASVHDLPLSLAGSLILSLSAAPW
jgi:hypothetical protein